LLSLLSGTLRPTAPRRWLGRRVDAQEAVTGKEAAN